VDTSGRAAYLTAFQRIFGAVRPRSRLWRGRTPARTVAGRRPGRRGGRNAEDPRLRGRIGPAPGEEAVGGEDVDVLVVDAQRLEWRGTADEQLQVNLTGAIQLVAVQERAAAGRHQSRRLHASSWPRTITRP
jgi:hypothetical protein